MTAARIVVGYDGSAEARAAVDWAVAEAARTGGFVEFVYADEWPVWAPGAATAPALASWPDGEFDRRVRGMLDEAVGVAQRHRPPVLAETAIVSAGAAATLVERSKDARLIVVGSRGHSSVAGLLGSVSVAVSAHAHCPVVVVRSEPAPDLPVVVGVDGSAGAQLAVEFAASQAAERGVPLHILRAWPTLPGTEDERRDLAGQTEQWQQKWPGLTVVTEAVTEHPAAALLAAGDQAQLLVVGSRGRGAFGGMLLGSVSQHLLRHAACTVAVVREAGPIEDLRP